MFVEKKQRQCPPTNLEGPQYNSIDPQNSVLPECRLRAAGHAGVPAAR